MQDNYRSTHLGVFFVLQNQLVDAKYIIGIFADQEAIFNN